MGLEARKNFLSPGLTFLHQAEACLSMRVCLAVETAFAEESGLCAEWSEIFNRSVSRSLVGLGPDEVSASRLAIFIGLKRRDARLVVRGVARLLERSNFKVHARLLRGLRAALGF